MLLIYGRGGDPKKHTAWIDPQNKKAVKDDKSPCSSVSCCLRLKTHSGNEDGCRFLPKIISACSFETQPLLQYRFTTLQLDKYANTCIWMHCTPGESGYLWFLCSCPPMWPQTVQISLSINYMTMKWGKADGQDQRFRIWLPGSRFLPVEPFVITKSNNFHAS